MVMRPHTPRPAPVVAEPSGALDVHGATAAGPERSKNEDQFLVARLRRTVILEGTSIDPTRAAHPGCDQGRILVIADGMGGHARGDHASRTAVETVVHEALCNLPWIGARADDEIEADEILGALEHGVRLAKKRVEQIGDGFAGAGAPGTTLTMAYVAWPFAYVAHAGDSRCYLHRARVLRQITRDHTLAQQLADDPKLGGGAFAHSPFRHMLTNAVGGGVKDMQVELHTLHLREGDTLLLTTDGITGVLEEPQIARELERASSAQDAVFRLLHAARAAGTTDDCTAIVARAPKRAAAS